MEEERPELDLSSDVMKNLSSEFDQLAEVDPGPGTTDPGPTGLGTGPTLAPLQVVPVSVHATVVPPAQASTTTATAPLHVSFPAPAPTSVSSGGTSPAFERWQNC